jgi:hypothetical protein
VVLVDDAAENVSPTGVSGASSRWVEERRVRGSQIEPAMGRTKWRTLTLANSCRRIRLSQHRLQANTGNGPGVRSASRQEGVTDMPQGKGTGKVYTVETDPKGGWRGKAKGSTRAVAKGDNKAEVMKRTIEVAKKQPKARVRIKGKNGRIQKELAYPRGSDLKRTPG